MNIKEILEKITEEIYWFDRLLISQEDAEILAKRILNIINKDNYEL